LIPRATFDRAARRAEYERVRTPLAAYGLLMQMLIRIDLAYLRLHPEVPALHDASVRVADGCGREEMCDVGVVLAAGEGSAVDLVAWRTAELLLLGRAPRARIVAKRRGGGFVALVEIVVDGRIERPWATMSRRAVEGFDAEGDLR
jgi:hypothetical protein